MPASPRPRPPRSVHRPVARWGTVALAAVVAAAVAVACSGETATQPTATASTPAAPDPAERTITVSALGRATGRPEAMALQIGVEVFGASTGATMQALSSAATALTDFLRAYGVADDDIQTSSLWASPNYGMPTNSGQPSISGYQASEMFTVRVDDIESAAALLDGAAAAVGDAFRLQGLWWTLTETDPLLAAARLDGVERARQQARELAEATGLTLGEVQAVSENGLDNPYLSYSPMAEGIPFNAGTQQVYTEVTVTFAVD